MTIRLFSALLCGAALILATQVDVAWAQSTLINISHSNIRHPGSAMQDVSTTQGRVLPKNQSDRMGGGGGVKGASKIGPQGDVGLSNGIKKSERLSKTPQKH